MSTAPNTPNLLTESDFIPPEPPVLQAGDSWKWTRAFPGYSSGDGWTLQYVLNQPGGALFQFPAGTITADEDGQSFDILVPSTDTASVVAGFYDLYAVLKNTGLNAQQTAKLQTVNVQPNIAGATASIDTRSFAKKTLDALESAISGDASPLVQEYEIHGRKVRYMDRMELLKLREQFKLEYREERIARGEFVPKRTARVVF